MGPDYFTGPSFIHNNLKKEAVAISFKIVSKLNYYLDPWMLSGAADGSDGRGQRPGRQDEGRRPGARLRCSAGGQQVSLLFCKLCSHLFIFFFPLSDLCQFSPSYVLRFLESQLRGQRSQQEEGLRALQQQANQRAPGSASADEQFQVHEGDEAGIKLHLSCQSAT